MCLVHETTTNIEFERIMVLNFTSASREVVTKIQILVINVT